MPSFLHETMVQAFLNRPGLATELLPFGQLVPPVDAEARIGSAELTEVPPAELRADALVQVAAPGGKLTIIIEVQLGEDQEKVYSWPQYLLAARRRNGCPVVLLVVTPFQSVARWARKRLPVLPVRDLQATVIGPEELPRITDPARARESPELALLSLLASRDDDVETAVRVAQAAEFAFLELPVERASLYFDSGRQMMRDAVRQAMEEQMGTPGRFEYQSEFARRYVAEGREKGLEEGREKGLEEGREKGREEGREKGIEEGLVVARRVLARLLSLRFGALPKEAQEQLAGADLATIERWTDVATTAESLADVFASR